MRKILLTLFLSALVYSLSAQQDSVLRAFKFRNINYRAVNFNIGGGGQYSEINPAPGKNESQSTSWSTGANFYQIKSTDRILFTLSGSLNLDYGASKNLSPSGDSKNRSFHVGPQIFIQNKWFGRKLFTEAGAVVSSYTSNTSSKNTSFPSSNKTNWGRPSFVVTLGIGKGRLENITDMQNAIWLNKSLQKEGRLTRPLSAEELNGLGRAVTSANNTRVLDARKRTQFILEAVDDYFQQRGLVSKTDIKYFSNLNDIVFFAFNDPRLSGTETFIRATPGITLSRSKYTQQPSDIKNKTATTDQSVVLSIGINKYVPLNLQHQNNFGIALELGYFSYDYSLKNFSSGILQSEIDFESAIRQAGARLFFQHAIYPNTRTMVGLKFDTHAGYQDTENESGFFGTMNLTASMNYFISYRTRFTCHVAASYQENVYAIGTTYTYLQPRTIQLLANAGLQVSL